MKMAKIFLSRDESNAIKGLLMILIVLGHNMIFTYAVQKWQLMTYFYLFHIQSFFLLVFFYGSEPLSRQKLSACLVRLGIPFLIFYSACTVIYQTWQGWAYFSICQFLLSFFSGNSSDIRFFSGVQVFWFLPGFLIFLIAKGIVDYKVRWLNAILYSLGLSYSISQVIISAFPENHFPLLWLLIRDYPSYYAMLALPALIILLYGSYGASRLLCSFPRLHHCLFPRDWHDFRKNIGGENPR